MKSMYLIKSNVTILTSLKVDQGNKKLEEQNDHFTPISKIKMIYFRHTIVIFC